MYSEYVGMHSLKCIDDGDAILCAGSSLFRAHVYQESEHVEICRDLGNPNGDVPSVVLSEDECERVAKLMNQKASKSISFEDL
jgi:hypothetical protein